LKAEIGAAGGNVQPIKVRPFPVLNGSTPEGEEGFELIYGHRRHRACLELGLPVQALVEVATDISLFEQMERENRGRKNLSAWEQGAMYRRAIDDGLYSSLRRMAESLKVDVSLVSKSVTLARLPEVVISAFDNPLDIQFRWAAALAEAVQKDPDGIVTRAKALAADRGKLRPAAIFASLVAAPAALLKGSTPEPLSISKAGKKVATLTTDGKGRAIIRFEVGCLPDAKRKSLAKLVEDFLKG
jgi:ParB family chromosome partitioning protein